MMADPIRTYVAPANVSYRDGPSGNLCITRGGERFAVYDDGDVVEYVMDGEEVVEARWPQGIDLSLLEEVDRPAGGRKGGKMARVITLDLCEEFRNATANSVAAVHNAIGYLANWASHSPRYAKCDIYGDKDGNLHATYSNDEGRITYQIMGMYREDDYSFHS